MYTAKVYRIPVERPVNVYDVAHGDCALHVRGKDDSTWDPVMVWNSIFVAGGVVGRVHARVACTVMCQRFRSWNLTSQDEMRHGWP